MAPEVQTRNGQCPTHGTIEATRQIPRIQFPYLVFVVRRSLAKRRPFLCPMCGSPVK